MNRLITVLLFCCSVFVFGKNNDHDGFEMDYFFSRTRPASKCEDPKFNHQCGIKCGGKYMCTHEKCFCFLHNRQSENPKSAKIISKLNNQNFVANSLELNDGVENVKNLALREGPEFPESSEYRPVLRHHIAHFCENLETARACIRTCMKSGKPAFCGKDHNCYCGHRYKYSDKKDPVVDSNDVYAEFKDLYAKYFGPTEKTQVVVLSDSDEKSSGEEVTDWKNNDHKKNGNEDISF